ncbi:MAG: tetratricopeptide repeat protein [Kiritimatiellae bacterium]|nr:tetratricopeptide repeat protein [Kiritimatiellia bacterium]
MKSKLTISLLTTLVAITLCGCGNNTEKDLKKGIAKISDGNYKAAVTIFERAIKKNPQSASAQCNLGIAYWKLERSEEAITALKAASSISDSAPEPLEFIGQIYVSEDRLEEAKLAFQEASKRAPDSARIITSLAIIEYYRGEFHNCELLLKKAVNTDPKYPAALFNLAVMYNARIGGKAKAEYYFTHYLETAPNGARKDIATNFIESRKNNTTTETNRIAKQPQPATILKVITKKIEANKTDEAFILLTDTVKKYPASADALWMHASLYNKINNKDKAASTYANFKRIFPADPRAKQIPEFKAAVKTKTELAAEAFTEADKLYDNAKYDEAMVAYKKALKYDPDMVNALYTIGHIYNSKKDYKQARKYFKKTIKKNSDLIEARYMLAIVNYELGDNQSAKEQLQVTMEMDPFYSQAVFMLGLINRKENNVKEARHYFKRFISIDPNSPQAKEAQQWLLATGE